jgi:hypothetical protein
MRMSVARFKDWPGKETTRGTVFTLFLFIGSRMIHRHSGNGWSLLSLIQTLKVKGRTADAVRTQAAFDQVWASANITLTRCAF